MNNCKFQKLLYEVSYDNGDTWQPVVPQRTKGGALIEYDSQDCTDIGTIYRWRVLNGQYICDGHSKYVKEVRDESYNGGATWYPSYPATYRTGQYVGEDAEYCKEDKFVGHYIPGDDESLNKGCKRNYMWNGFSCVYVDPIKVVKCPDYPYTESYITTGITQYYTSGFTLSHCTIGDCVTGIGDGAFAGNSAMTRINSDVEGEAILPSGVTTIGQGAFYHCNGLRTIDLPSGITSIGASAFTDDYMVRSVYLRATLPPKLGESAFTNVTFANACGIYVPCRTAYLHSYNWRNYRDRLHTLPDSQGCEFKLFSSHWNSSSAIATNDFSVSCNDSSVLSSGETYLDQNRYQTTDVVIGNCVTEIGDSAFNMMNAPSLYEGGWLSSVTISDSVTSIGSRAFCDCHLLSAITIPDAVTTIGWGAFQGCIDLGCRTDVDIPSGVTTISNSLFEGCYNDNCDRGLTTVSMTSGVTSIGNRAFYGCKALWTIALYEELPATGYSGIHIPLACTSIGESAFENCNPYMVYIPNSVTTIGNRAFAGCSGTSFTVSATVPPTLGVDVFKDACIPDGVHNPPAIYVPCESLEIYRTASGWSEYADKIHGIPPCDEPVPPAETKWVATYTGGTTSSAECGSSSVIKSGEIQLVDLESVEVGNCVLTISSYTFSNCNTLSAITIPDNVTTIEGRVFSGCTSLSNVTIGSGVTRIGNYAFTNCSSLTEINIPGSITSIGASAFMSCTNLTAFTIHATTPPSIGQDVFTNSSNCFIYVPCESVNAYKTAANWSHYANRITCIQPVFNGKWLATYTGGTTSSAQCDTSSAITSGEVATTDLVSVEIGDCTYQINTDAFKFYTSLTSINIPNNVAIIGNEAFYFCTGLTSVTIGSGITSIGTGAFRYCSSLTGVTVNATTPPTLGAYAFSDYNNCTIYVPAASVNAYKTASGWSTYASRIQAIP